jgi:NAD+ synthase (glutamine-hydrolysing)
VDHIRIAGAQLNLTVGDLETNTSRILETIAWAQAQRAQVVVFPELSISGYPPEDLVLRDGFVSANLDALQKIAEQVGDIVAIVGFVDRVDKIDEEPDDATSRTVANAAAILHQGEMVGTYHKVLLPNYGVFDESRYFVRGGAPADVHRVIGVNLGVSVCEDIWIADGPPAQQAAAGAQVLVNINASPYDFGKAAAREQMLVGRAREAGVPLVYVNLVGGQDELVFDGGSLIVAADGTVLHRSPQFVEDRFVFDVPLAGVAPGLAGSLASPLDANEELYSALATGLGDYVRKNGFEHVVIGLSGGIDSALTAALATDALGPENVWGISMPSRFSSEGSIHDSKELADRLGIRFDVLPMDDIFQAHLRTLEPVFVGTESGVAEENLQARVRGALLMAVSNKFGGMVVATGNKSELAVGYATLYGDMAGGYAVLKDVFKMQVYELSRWRNRNGIVIPQSIIDKAPSAELRPDQKDSDSLPEYPILDAILERYIEEDRSIRSIVEEGYDEAVVRRVCGLVDRNEYKRRQAAPGVKISVKAFGKDRRLPITSKYRGG